nr:hypothetical protein [Geodermatophilus sp. TF02-6]
MRSGITHLPCAAAPGGESSIPPPSGAVNGSRLCHRFATSRVRGGARRSATGQRLFDALPDDNGFPAGTEGQHVVPSWDTRTLYATDDVGNTMTPIDPTTGAHGARIPVDDPYDTYPTPDGSAAISVAEDRKALVFYDPHTWQEQSRTPLPDCAGVDHVDYTADGRLAVSTCEFAGRVAVVDIASRTLVRMIDMPARAPTASTSAGTPSSSTSPTGWRAAPASWTPTPARPSRSGPSRTAAPTWAG